MTPGAGSGAGRPGKYLDQLHDEMANNLLQIHTGLMGIINAGKKHEEGVDVSGDIENFGTALGNAIRLSEEVLKKYGAVAAGDLEPPPDSYAKSLESLLSKEREARERAEGALQGMSGDAQKVFDYTMSGYALEMGPIYSKDDFNPAACAERLARAVLSAPPLGQNKEAG
jgi:hypothetical protein